jgi:hypothetical protein
MSWALQAKWLWLQKTGPNRPWSGLDLPIQPQARQLFASSIISFVGNGKNTLFWSDRWLNGCYIQDIAPEVAAKVDKKTRSSRTVAQGQQIVGEGHYFPPFFTRDAAVPSGILWERLC